MGYQVKGFDMLGLVMERLSMPFPCIQRKISVLFRRTYIFSLKNCIYVCTGWAGISEKSEKNHGHVLPTPRGRVRACVSS